MEGTRARRNLSNAAIAALVLSLLSSSLALLDPLDFLSLQSIRQSLSDPPGSTFFSSWDFSGDPCSFAGVLCAGDRIAALSLGDPRAGSPGLLGSLSPALGSLTALSELTLVPGRVSGEIPLSLSNLTSLQFLALSGNLLSGRIPPSIGLLPRISTVDLSFNLLSGEIPLSLSSSLSLSNLVLSHNRLSGEIPPFRSPSLLRLDLKHNNLSGEVTALPESLHYLSLAWNRLSGRVGGKLTSLVNLNYLDLSMNRFRGGVPPELFTFPLVSLQLQRNRFTGPVILPAEVGIQTVDLSYNRFTGTIPARFAEVRTLYLNNNRFTGEVPARFVSRLLDQGIQVLYLQHNFLTGIQMNPTAEIPTSSSLCLQYNCMVPPVAPPCPLRAGAARSRPAAQCIDWRG